MEPQRELSKFEDREFYFKQIVYGTLDEVFDAWTDQDVIARWWGPEGFTNPVCKVDPREEGKIYIEMKSPSGVVYPMDGFFHEIVVPKLVSFSARALDPNSNRPLLETLVTVSFTADGDQTIVLVKVFVVDEVPEGRPYLEGLEVGWQQSLKRLSDLFKN